MLHLDVLGYLIQFLKIDDAVKFVFQPRLPWPPNTFILSLKIYK
jgi:hypothetical protein